MSSTYPPFANTGKPIIRKNLQPGQSYKCHGSPNVNTIIDRIGDFVRIRRADGWIVRFYDDNPLNETIVYLIK